MTDETDLTQQILRNIQNSIAEMRRESREGFRDLRAELASLRYKFSLPISDASILNSVACNLYHVTCILFQSFCVKLPLRI